MVHAPDDRWWARRALERLGREPTDDAVEEIASRLAQIPSLSGYDEDELRVDTSLETNRTVMLGRFLGVGLDRELAETLYALDLEPRSHPVYPDVPEVLSEIRERDVRLALVSDFHADLRPELQAAGILRHFDAVVISFEHGFQKPDPRMFATALEALGAMPRVALMVGDRASHDGGAAAVGIDTLILPPPAAFGPRGLDVVLRLL